MAFPDEAIGGQTLVRPAIHSPNFVAGAAGWSINRDGSAEFNDATIRGNVDVIDPVTHSEVVIDVVNLIGAAVEIYGQGGPAAYPLPGRIFGDAGVTGAGALDITSPAVSVAAGYDQADILMSTANPGLSQGAQIALQAPGDGVYASDHLYVIGPGGGIGQLFPTGVGVGDIAVTSGSDSTTSGSYVDMGGTGAVTAVSFTKLYDDSRIRIRMEVGMWSQTSASTVELAVHIGGTDYRVGRYSFDAATAHRSLAFTGYIPGGANTAGAYTLQARWRRPAGTGTLIRDTNDWFGFSAEECA